MLVLLPKEGKTLAGLEKDLTGEKLEAVRAGLEDQKVKVSLPRFNFSSGFNLKGTLAALGMPSAFMDTADFSGMDGKKDLFISDVFHKAFIAVDEKETEAAAATAVVMQATMAMPMQEPPPKVFRRQERCPRFPKQKRAVIS